MLHSYTMITDHPHYSADNNNNNNNITDDETHQRHLQRVGDYHQQQEEHGQRNVGLHHRPHRAQGTDRQVTLKLRF